METTSETQGTIGQFWIDEYDFQLLTPAKSISSIALISNFNRIKLLATFDFEIINYGSAQLSSIHSFDNIYYYDFFQENNNINNYYSKTNNKKVGLFFSIDNLSIRSGYAVMGNPFKNNNLNSWNQEYLSGGIGYRINNYSIDISMSRCITNEDHILYYTATGDQFANLNQKQNTIILSCSYKF